MVVQRLAVLSILATSAWAQCERSVDLDFVVLADEASHRAIEDDIRADLALVGVNAVPRYLEKEEFNAAMVAGDYDLVFSETWGAPYDPHSYVASWTTPDEAHYPVLETLEPPMDPESFDVLVDDVLSEVDLAERQSKWTDILTEIHADVIHLPLWGKRIPSVVSKVRVEDYLPGEQQFEYRVDRIRVIDGSKNISLSPGAQTGLFQSVGPMEPHGYRPNEFFSNNWLYESLVSYGPNGNIEPALASSWSSSVNDDGSETFRFAIRQGVTFHDGAEFNCSVVELNFDHVFAPPLRGPDWHGWYGLPGALEDWSCDGETFVLRTTTPYYPLLQELTYIRPLRMLSPNSFHDGINTSPVTHNSCPASWGVIDHTDGTQITCVGSLAPSGTGPFRFVSRSTNDEGNDDVVVFQQHVDYWAGAPDIEYLHIVRHETSAEVKDALLAGEIDAVLGAGVLEPQDLQDFLYDDAFEVLHSEPTQNTVLIMNIDDIQLRKVVVHAVNKAAIVERELGGIEEPVSQLFPESAPYCDVDLLPKFDYDYEKATLLFCGDGSSSKKSKKSSADTLFIVLFVIALVAAILLVLGVCFMVRKERKGEPLFSPLTNPLYDDADEVQLPKIKEEKDLSQESKSSQNNV